MNKVEGLIRYRVASRVPFEFIDEFVTEQPFYVAGVDLMGLFKLLCKGDKDGNKEQDE